MTEEQISGTQLSETQLADEQLRTKTQTAIWAAVSITLLPLVPYALGGIGG